MAGGHGAHILQPNGCRYRESGSAACDTAVVRAGIAHHLGWAVVVTVAADGEIVDRRRIELIEPGQPVAPIHHDGGFHELHRSGDHLDDDALGALVARVEGSVRRAVGVAIDALDRDLGDPIAAFAVRTWPEDLPTDLAILRRPPCESKVDSYMYSRLIAEVATRRGRSVVRYDARHVEADAIRALGGADESVLARPRATLGAPWGKDQRLAYAAAIVAGPSV